jgi:hypothetical protein
LPYVLAYSREIGIAIVVVVVITAMSARNYDAACADQKPFHCYSPSLHAQFGIFVPPGSEENPEDNMSSEES